MSSVASPKSPSSYPPHVPRFKTQEKSVAAPQLTTKTLSDALTGGWAQNRTGVSAAPSDASRSRASSPSDLDALAFDDELLVDLGNTSDSSQDAAAVRQRDAKSPSTDSATSSDSSQSSASATAQRATRSHSAGSSNVSRAASSRAETPGTARPASPGALASSREASPPAAWAGMPPDAPPAPQSLRRRLAFACDSIAPKPISRGSSVDAQSVIEAPASTMALLPIARPPQAPVAATHPLSVRHASMLIGSSVVATLGAVGLAYSTQSMWREPLAQLVGNAQREAGRYIVNPLAARLFSAAHWLGQWGYQEPAAPAPFDVTLEWQEIAMRMQRLGLGMGDLIEGQID